MSLQLQGSTNYGLATSAGGFATHAANITTLTASTISVIMGNKFYSRTAVASIAWVIEPNSGLDPRNAQAFQTVPAGKACVFAFLLDPVAGTFTQAQGPLVDVGSNCPLPPQPLGKLVVAALKISNASYTTNGGYRAGTDAHNSAGLTRTFFDLAGHVDNL